MTKLEPLRGLEKFFKKWLTFERVTDIVIESP